MNKTELVSHVAEKAGITKKDAAKAVDAVFASVQDALVAKDKVQLIGFGSFAVKTRKARQGHNPQKPAEKITIPAAEVPVFKPGKALKAAVNPAKKSGGKKKK